MDVHWSVLNSPSGVELQWEGQDTLNPTLSVTSDLSDAFQLEVQVTTPGDTATSQLAFDVRETPRIAIPPAGIRDVCPNEIIEWELDEWAEGGDPATYQWQVVATVGESEPQDAGLRLNGSVFEGRFAAQKPAGEQRVTLRLELEDAFCSSNPTIQTARQMSEGNRLCPELETVHGGQTSLPEPCLGAPYEEQLRIEQTGADVTALSLEQLQTFSQMSFDPETKTVSGIAHEAGQLLVRLTDETQSPPRIIETQYTMTPRNHCWFGYIGGTNGPPRFQLLDAELQHQATSNYSFPPTEQFAAQQVLDFKFSPGGQFVVYRLRNEADFTHLRLLDLATRAEEALEFSASVLQYEWSPISENTPESAFLAVAFSEDEVDFLGGVDLTGAALSSSPQVIEGLKKLAPVPIEVVSEMRWLSGEQLAFFTPDPNSGELTVATVRIGNDEILSPSIRFDGGYSFEPSPYLIGGEGGIFVRNTVGGRLDFFDRNGGGVVGHGRGLVVSSDDGLVGLASDGNLEIFREYDASSGSAKRQEGCDGLLASSSSSNQVACVRSLPNGSPDRLRLFLASSEPSLEVSFKDVTGGYNYGLASYPDHHRLFSPGGSQFAFSTDDNIYVLDLGRGSPLVAGSIPRATLSSGPTALSFSPNGNVLAVQAGSILSWWSSPNVGDAARGATAEMAPPQACTEELDGPEGQWCGSALSRAPRWSPNGSFLAATTEQGGLKLIDTRGGGFDPVFNVEEGCVGECLNISQYDFQPK